MADLPSAPKGVIAGVVHRFLTSQLSIIMIILSLCLGVAAILVTPREEDPQIVVPLADIYVSTPGASAEEVEKLVATPLERLLWQIDGVEYVYSMSSRDMAVVTVRFYVGEERENSILKVHNRIAMYQDEAPPIVRGWVVKPVEIDDVPIVNLTLFSDRYDDHELRRIGEEVLARLSAVKDISRTQIVGGRSREVRVELLPERMVGLGVSLPEVRRALMGADASVTAGTFSRANRSTTVTANAFLASAGEVGALVVGVHEGRPVYLRDVAAIVDGPQEAAVYSRIGYAHHYRSQNGLEETPRSYPAVTLALAKKKGTNAVTVAANILDELEILKKEIIPDGVWVETTRNTGDTAQQKVNELLASLAFAIVTVVVLLAFSLGWREALVVALAVPISFSLALFVNYLFGYTINRVTLFALILSLGLVVDDPITNVDNIQRHMFSGIRGPIDSVLFAVNEVLPPVIMSTIAIILSFTPLFFITGMMGPYMGPMASNVPMTVIFSTLCALTIVPWMTYLLLKNHPVTAGAGSGGPQAATGTRIHRLYRAVVAPFLVSRTRRYGLLAAILILLIVPVGLAVFRLVPLKMLPFDNKNEFQIVVDMPEGTTLEATDAVVRQFERYLRTVPEVTSVVATVGDASPIDFNGLVRHYYLRKGPHLADLRVNLVGKNRRAQQSHAIVLRLRKDLERIAHENRADIKLVETPPGPPVMSTLVTEIYGDKDVSYGQLINGAAHIKTIMAAEPFVTDIDDSTEADRERIDFVVDKEKAALHGVSTRQIIETLRIALSGDTPATLHLPGERQTLRINTILPRQKRSGEVELSQVPVKGAAGAMIPLAELVTPVHIARQQPIYHKNLERVVFVTGEMAGRAPGEAVLDMIKRLRSDPMPRGTRAEWAGEGEWKITLRVFRDMGIAFAAALTGIYILLIVQTGSFFMPMLIMMAIPLTLIGAMPGFWLLNLVTGKTVGGFADPVFFTATGMIGMIALGGIVIRNSIVLIEFIQDAIKEGLPFDEAILQSGAIRMRPILLTAATTALGAWPITLDPIFSGLAWTLIFGLLASTVFTLVVIPVTYYALYRHRHD
ncbi:acriflavine resistance protein B [Desulfosarcina alkanivorans]|uniref:Acriflavine resistance protein B n=1 Tax=Desulfosarcina alkanivorans TaxID=571177 RepID=A0A5K7YX84_9BACT|nr:efflux RND transporter permease subunit [Desulfosarcina alkanivorans]BBO69297.1 acriflavine resistance protein B [Desulfosarcina alkanivorans]